MFLSIVTNTSSALPLRGEVPIFFASESGIACRLALTILDREQEFHFARYAFVEQKFHSKGDETDSSFFERGDRVAPSHG